MSCAVCGDKGLVRVNWADAESDFAVCLCRVGLAMRSDRNATRRTVPLWQVWAAREQVDPSRVVMLKDVLTAEELAERGFDEPSLSEHEMDAVIAAVNPPKGKL